MLPQSDIDDTPVRRSILRNLSNVCTVSDLINMLFILSSYFKLYRMILFFYPKKYRFQLHELI